MQQTAHMSHHVAATLTRTWAIFRQPIWIDAISESISFIHPLSRSRSLPSWCIIIYRFVYLYNIGIWMLIDWWNFGSMVPWMALVPRIFRFRHFEDLIIAALACNICSPAAECRNDLQSEDADVARQEASMAVLQHPSPAPLLHEAGLVPLPTLRLLLFAQRKRTWFFIGSHKKFCPWLEAFFSVSIA